MCFKLKTLLDEDNDIIVINKPSGLVVHPGNGNKDGTLVNGLVYHFKKLSTVNTFRPGIVHRLDKETSGIMVIAKNDKAHFSLSKQFLYREVKKIYFCLAWGKVKNEGLIENFIIRNKYKRTKFQVSKHKGRDSS